MDKKEFKKLLKTILEEYSFTTKNNISRAETDDLIIVISTQKSNYDNSYYLNYGFLIKELSPELVLPNDNQCDVFGRFNFNINGKVSQNVDFQNINSEEFSIALRMSLNERIKPVLDFGINKYFEYFPSAILTVRAKAKKYLGY